MFPEVGTPLSLLLCTVSVCDTVGQQVRKNCVVQGIKHPKVGIEFLISFIVSKNKLIFFDQKVPDFNRKFVNLVSVFSQMSFFVFGQHITFENLNNRSRSVVKWKWFVEKHIYMVSKNHIILGLIQKLR